MNGMTEDYRRIQNAAAACRRDIAKFWATHKEVVEELPCADLNGAKMFAEAFGYKYEVKMHGGAVYYKNADDIGTFTNTLSSKWACAVPSKSGFTLVIYKVVEI